jgi:AraC family transcriptional regulator
MSGTLQNGSFYGGVQRDRRVADLTLAETSYEPGFVVPPHEHAHPFFCLALRGTFDERFDRRSWTGVASTVFYHPAAAEHAEVFGERGGRLFNVQLGHPWLERLEAFELRPPERQVDATGGRLTWLLGSLYREFRQGDTAADLAIDGLALTVMAHVIREAGAGSGPAPDAARTRPGWLDRVVELLHDRAGQAMDMAGIAAEVDIHPVHMARVFRRYEGCSPGEYLRRVRVRRACRLLSETDDTLSSIALRTGYADQSHFTRNFKRAFGVPPGEYRRLTRD